MANRNVEKGKAFERRVAQMLTKALGYSFFRSVVNSTVAMHHDRDIYGDVISSNEGFPFCIECKSYKDFKIHGVLAGDTVQFDGFWHQTQKQADDANKKPLLLVTNSKQSYAFFRVNALTLTDFGTTYIRVNSDVRGDVVGMELTRFIKYLKETI